MMTDADDALLESRSKLYSRRRRYRSVLQHTLPDDKDSRATSQNWLSFLDDMASLDLVLLLMSEVDDQIRACVKPQTMNNGFYLGLEDTSGLRKLVILGDAFFNAWNKST